MNPEDVRRYTFRIVPTIRKNLFAQSDYYKHEQYAEEGLPTGVNTEEKMDCSDALAVIANIKAKL